MTTALGGLGVLSGLGSLGQATSAPLVRLGAADDPAASEAAYAVAPGITSPTVMAAAQVAGSAVSGAIVGGIAASDWRGATTGAATVAGMSGLGLAIFAPSLTQSARLAYGALGAVGLAGGLWMAYKRKR